MDDNIREALIEIKSHARIIKFLFARMVELMDSCELFDSNDDEAAADIPEYERWR